MDKIERKKIERKLRQELRAIGLNCEELDYFIWLENERQFDMTVSMDLLTFIDTAKGGYTEKKKEEIKKYARHIVDKMTLEFQRKELREYEDKLSLVINYNSKQGVLPTVYCRTIYYNPLYHPYNEGWISLLEKNEYKADIERSKLVSVFSKADGEQIIRCAMVDLEIRMDLIQEWLEREVRVRVGNLIEEISAMQVIK